MFIINVLQFIVSILLVQVGLWIYPISLNNGLHKTENFQVLHDLYRQFRSKR
jgi:hypothetical protein